MKYIILTILVTITFPLFADQYVVEFKVVDGIKKQVSSYTIPDGETPDTANPYVLVTAEEYALLGTSRNVRIAGEDNDDNNLDLNLLGEGYSR